MAPHRIENLYVDFSIIELTADVPAKANVEMAGDFARQSLCIEGKELEVGELWLQRSQEDFVYGGLDLWAALLLLSHLSAHSPGSAPDPEGASKQPQQPPTHPTQYIYPNISYHNPTLVHPTALYLHSPNPRNKHKGEHATGHNLKPWGNLRNNLYTM